MPAIRPYHPNALHLRNHTAFDILSLIDEIDSDCSNDAIYTAIAILALNDHELRDLRNMLETIDPRKSLADANPLELSQS